jgi:hypothetical protein
MQRTDGRRGVRGGWGAALAVPMLLASCAPAPRVESTPAIDAAAAPRRAILFSIDALSEPRVRESLGAEFVPGLRAMFEQGACVAHSVPAFPSLTAPGHAALWTGAFGDVSGIRGNSQPRVPREAHTLLDQGSGYSAEWLRAEPLWIALARQGRRVVGHHVTQAPQPPGHPLWPGEDTGTRGAQRAADAAALSRPGVAVLNGYDRLVAPHRVLTADSIRPRPAQGWRNLERLGGGVAPLEIAWASGADSLFALFHGASAYDRVLVAPVRDASRGVLARAMPAEREPVRGRPLARHFGEPLELPMEDGRTYLRARLFELAPDGSRYLLYVPAMYVVLANGPDVQASYDRAVRGWLGNSALRNFERGAFGPLLREGGDGGAEARYLETLELVTRQFMRGAEWGWREQRAELLMDYFPVADEVDHALYGYLARDWPGWDAEVERRVQHVRQRVWEQVDLRYEHLRALVREAPGAVLFVSGDHGMRASWRQFRPNVALQQAGLQALDAEGRIDLSRTRALSANGYWISVNRAAWSGGIVPPAEEAAVIAAAERALRAARDEAGRPIVTEVYRPDTHPGLGLGSPVGGDLYWGTAPGIRSTGAPRGALVSDAPIDAGHGFPSVDPDMWTSFCAIGGPLQPRRTAATRSIDVAPTVADWLGAGPPRNAVGRSVWAEMMGGSR